MARRHDAIAATNGTYGLPWGRPIGLFSEDGKLHTSPLLGKRAFSISRDETLTHIGSPNLQMSARVLDTDSRWRIDTSHDPRLVQIGRLRHRSRLTLVGPNVAPAS